MCWNPFTQRTSISKEARNSAHWNHEKRLTSVHNRQVGTLPTKVEEMGKTVLLSSMSLETVIFVKDTGEVVV